MGGLRRCLSSRSLIATHGAKGVKWIAETAQLAVQLRHDFREGWRGNVVTKELMSSRDRPTLTASVEEGCEIHKPNRHNESRQPKPPHKQTRKHELAL